MKNILLAISGLTPQIVTETLFALSVQKKIPIDEIFILTTERGKAVLQGKDKAPTTPKSPLKKEIEELCKAYNIKTPKFIVAKNVVVAEEESTVLYDIKTDKENILFPNKAAEIVKKLTKRKNVAIYASIAGGRKSMSAHLSLVMSLFARSQDKLFHVLTDEKYEFMNFYPKSKEEEEALVLAEIPFVKLKCLNSQLLNESLPYYDIVERTQEQLKFLTEDAKLVVEIKKKIVRYKEKQVILTPIQIGLYSLFVEQKVENGASLSMAEISGKEFSEKLKLLLEEHFNFYFDLKEKNHWSNVGLGSDYFLSVRSKTNKKLETLFDDEEMANQFLIVTDRG